jgi:large subunit ribosomal protein L16
MALLPSRVKYRKTQRGNRGGNASVCNKIDYGEFGLQCLERGWIKNNQIEACRVAITRLHPCVPSQARHRTSTRDADG